MPLNTRKFCYFMNRTLGKTLMPSSEIMILMKFFFFFLLKRITFRFRPELFVHPPKVPSKRAFQRSLHESYQYMMKLLIDQANAEAAKIRKRAAAQAAAQAPIPGPTASGSNLALTSGASEAAATVVSTS